MRTLAFLLALLHWSSGFGAKRVTVEELDRTLAAAQGLPDAEIAQKLSDLELTERLSSARLERLDAKLPGKRSRQALTILSDASVFLDPPAAEIPNQPTPDLFTQRKIMALTVKYVSQTVHQLPNLFATRVTTSFEDMPAVQKPGAITTRGAITGSAYQPIHLVGQFNATVTYRDGREVVEQSEQHQGAQTLSTSGVFGPILGTVLVDAARSNLAWSRWEQGAQGLQAVFGFTVPKEKSHYSITYDALPSDQGDAMPCSTTPQTFRQVVAYHGEIVIDPATGTILRLVLQSDIKPGQFTARSDVEVEYAPVDIGGKSYFLPVRSVSYTLAHALFVFEGDCARLDETLSLQKSLNDVVFQSYHVFRSDATILTDSEAAKLEQQTPLFTPAPPQQPANDLPAPATPSTSAQPASQVQAATPSGSTDANSGAKANPSPATPVTEDALPSETPVLRTNARDVVLDVVVTKGNGDPVEGLSRQDFEVKEDGKPQAIDFLEEHAAATASHDTPQESQKLPPGTYTNAPPAPVGDAVNVLLLDTLNTPQQDQAYVHNEIEDFLKKMRPGTRIAIFALGSKLRYVQGFTADTSTLLAALNDKGKGAAPVKVSRDSGDAADNAADMARLTMMQSMGVGDLQKALADMNSFDLGTRASMTFEALDHLARYLAGIPGRKNLIWFSSSFPVVIFPTAAQRENIEKSPQMHGYLQQVRKTANLFTVSQISIYPVGAQGMMVEHVGEADSAGPAAPEGSVHFGDQPDGPMSNSTMTPFMGGATNRGNTIATMQQLATSTGGKAYFNTNDLNGALKSAINDGAHYYTLSYSPTNAKMDGTYRSIEIHLKNGHYTLAYRHGYNADDASSLEQTAGTDPMAAVMKLGLPSATGLVYRVQAVPATEQPAAGSQRAGQNAKLAGPTVRYTVDFSIRLSDVAFRTGPDGERNGKLEAGLMAFDQNGNPVNWDRVTAAMSLKPAEFAAMQKAGIPVHMQLDLPDAYVNLVTGVYDGGSGKTGSLEIPLQAGHGAPAPAVR